MCENIGGWVAPIQSAADAGKCLLDFDMGGNRSRIHNSLCLTAKGERYWVEMESEAMSASVGKAMREISPAVGGTDGRTGALAIQELFQTAALILASQQEAVSAVEQAVAGAEIDPLAAPERVYGDTRERLTQLALERVVALDPSAFAPVPLGPASDVCLDTDDWEATGVTASQLNELVSGGGRSRLRDWLERLRPASRVIFVLRAILGQDSAAVAASLRRAGGGQAWTPAQVGQVFREALCSLATSLVQSPAAP